MILGTPSDQHEAQAIACLEAGKHTLIEIPIAMSLGGAERVVAAGERSGKIYGLSHPMRFRREREALLARTRAGEEKIRHIAGRFFIKRLVNIGATGYQRSWTDNILWHHFCHFVDLGMYLFDGAPIRRVQSHSRPLPPARPAFRWSAWCWSRPRPTSRCWCTAPTTRPTASMTS